MKAKWKDKPLDQVKPSNRQRDIAMLQQQIRVLESEAGKMLNTARYYKQQAGNLNARLQEHDDDVHLFRKLLQTEVMVPTPDGFKLLTGDELREYCHGLRPKPLTMKSITEQALEIMAQAWDEANQNHDKI